MTIGASAYANKTPENCKSIFKTVASFLSFKKTIVPLIKISGVIGKMPGRNSVSFECLSKILDKAFKNTSASAVVIVINSPGGSPTQCTMIADKISMLSSKTGIPVFTFAEDIAASAGYWLLCTGKESYACSSSIIGSIGVICAKFGLKEMIEKIGVERRVYAQGKHKALLDPFQSEDEDQVKIIETLTKDVYDDFISFVESRRKEKLKLSSEELFNGSIWTGKRASKLGLIDGIYSNYEQLIQEKFGEKAKIIKMNKKGWILDRIKSISYEKILDIAQSTVEFF